MPVLFSDLAEWIIIEELSIIAVGNMCVNRWIIGVLDQCKKKFHKNP